MLDIAIRHAAPLDIPVLKDLIEDSVRGLNAADYSPEQIESALKYVYGIDTQLIADGTYFVAHVCDMIVGCGGWSRRKTLYGGDQMKAGPDALLNPSNDPARIRAFFVHSHYARRGIGRRIMQLCEQHARDNGFMRLELMATLTGHHLYAVCGFEEVERVEVPLPDAVMFPVVRMQKWLS